MSKTAIKALEKYKKFPVKLVAPPIIPEPKQNRLWRLKNKTAQPTAAPAISPPSENLWSALRAAKEKAALTGDNSDFVPILVAFYDYARTYLSTKC